MKDLCPYLSPSGTYPDRNLLDSIPEDDRAGLLPIIKMAFPFLNGKMLQPFLPRDVDFSMQSRHSIIRAEAGIVQMNERHSPSSRQGMHLHDCGSENRRESFIQNVDDSMQMDESSSSLSISKDGLKGGQHHEVDILPYNFILPSLHLRQQHMMRGLQSMSCQPQSGACELDTMEIPCPFKGQQRLYAQTAELEKSRIMSDEKLSLSLGSTASEKDLHMDAASSMTHLLAYTSPESSWLQQQETSDGVVFPCGDFKRKRVSSLDLNSFTSHKSFERSMHEDGLSEAVHVNGDPGANFALVANKRKFATICSGEYNQGSKRVQILPYAEADGGNTQENMAMVVQMGRCDALNGSIPGLKTGSSDKSPCGSMLAPADEPTLAHVAVSENVDFTMEEPKLERCHRSNGKQWRCSKNATPGTLYCELHQAYRSKCKTRKSVSPAKKFQPCIQRENSLTPNNVQIELQRSSDGCSEQSIEAFVKEKQLDVARCRRTDGKLWQCSKQAMPGSTYCENHHKRRMKSKNKQKADSLGAGKNKAAVQNTADTSVGDVSCKHGRVNGSKEENGLDRTLICSSESMNVLDGCGVSISTREQSHEDRYGRKIMQLLRMGDVEGLVKSVMDGWKQDTVERASLHIASSEGTKNANGYSDSTEKSCSQLASWAVKEASSSDPRNACYSGDTNADHHSSENGHAVRCHRNDGKQWQCPQLCKPGFVHCEYHQGGQQKVRAGFHGQAQVEKPEKSYNEETGVQTFPRNLDGTGCPAGIGHHKEQVHKEIEQLNDDNASRDLFPLKQCQRKDGKGWQCSQHAKHGYNYCEHHLLYMSKRNVSKLCRKENRLLAAEKKREISSETELSSCRYACPSATPSIPKQGVSARGMLCPSNASPRQDMRSINEPLHVGMTYPSAAFSSQYLENGTSQEQHHCSQKQETYTADVATTPQESSSGSSVVCKGIQNLEICAAFGNPMLDTIDPPDIQKHEGGNIDSASNIQSQECVTSNTSPTAVHGVHKQERCIDYDSSFI